MLKKPPFTRTRLEGEESEDGAITFTVRCNLEEQQMLKTARLIFKQPKDSTCLKQLAKIGYFYVTQPLNKQVYDTVFMNEKRNKRIGINEIE